MRPTAHLFRPTVIVACVLFALLGTAASTPAQLMATRVIAGVAPTEEGGGAMQEEVVDDLPAETRAAIETRLAQSAARLIARDRLQRATGAPVRFTWPLQAPDLEGFSYYGISNYVDHDLRYPGYLLDFQCGSHTYDTSAGYNHSGVDIFLWPWPWNRMESGAVQVIAAADGVIVEKDDGNADHNCALSNKPWNAVYVRHSDGSTAWYGHLKRGSLTDKAVGDSVVRGDFLGTVGSSGSSTGPHLHFEVHDAAGTLVDPYSGPCNVLSAGSWWQQQPPYVDPAINAVTTGSVAPEIGTCPKVSKPNQQDYIVRDGKMVFTSYYRDQLLGAQALHTVYTPEGIVYASWSHTSPDSYAASYWYFSGDHFANGASLGMWRYEIQFAGQTYTHDFEVVDSPHDIPTSTRVPTRTPSGVVTHTPTPTAGPCAGDCGADGHVAVDELVRAVNIALGAASIDSCRAADSNADGDVSIAEVIAAVANALNDCAAMR